MNAPAANAFPKPRPYDLTDERELMRLVREVRGYIHTCRREHHGTDFSGRDYAMAALDKIIRGEIGIRTY